MTITVPQIASITSGSTSATPTFTLPAITSGNDIVFQFDPDSSITPTGVPTDDQSNTYVLDQSGAQESSAVTYFWRAHNVTNAPTTLTLHLSAVVATPAAVFYELSGVNASAVSAVYAAGHEDFNTVHSYAITTVDANVCLLCATMAGTNATYTNTSTLTMFTPTPQFRQGNFYQADCGAAGLQTLSFTQSASQWNGYVGVAYKPAGGATSIKQLLTLGCC